MGVENESARTHEPSLREVVAELDGFKELFRSEIAAVRELFRTQLAAQKELTNQAFVASRDAIVKAEESQRVYNATHNELSRKMESQYAHMIPRTEFERAFEGLDDLVRKLEGARSEGVGGQLLVARLFAAGWFVVGLIAVIVAVVRG
jgi:hypothetical protein